MKNERREVVFLVRMWRQWDEETSAAEWRGAIDQIDSGSRFYVTGAREVADFISAMLAREARSTP